jgi:imidazolonepropionase-like amidohydrolase
LTAAGIPLEESLKVVTANPARRVGLFERKGSLAVGKDADLLILDRHGDLDSVFAMGRLMLSRGELRVKGTFEE